MKSKAKALLLILMIGLMALLVVVLAIPPWKSYIPFLVQSKIGEWTGIYLHQFPGDYTGVWRIWDEHGNLVEEDEFKNGKRDGIWTHYESDGKKTITEYRNDKPWNGLCYMRYMKTWIAEYRQGKPWNGCFPVYDSKTETSISHYFIDGVEISEVNYKDHYHIPQNAICMGLTYYP